MAFQRTAPIRELWRLFDLLRISGCAFYLCGNAVAWSARKQELLALSLTEVEWNAAGATAAEVILLKGGQVDVVLLFGNKRDINLTKGFEDRKLRKHIEIKYTQSNEISGAHH